MNLLRPAILVLLLSVVSPAQAAADLIIKNGIVRTMDARRTVASAVAIKDGRIVALGSDSGISKFSAASTRVVDAQRRLVIPGFNDAHVHLTGVGNFFSHLDLSKTKEGKEIVERIAHFAKFLPKGRWILGGGLDQTRWNERSLPTLAQIDVVSPDNPVLIYFREPSAAVVNSAAFRAANISLVGEAVWRDGIIRDVDGKPRGVVAAKALDRVKLAVPANNGSNWSEIAEAASKYAASKGVTSIQDVHSDDLTDILRGLNRQGKLLTRVYDCIALSSWERDKTKITRAATGDAMVRNGCVKWMAEGDEGEEVELATRFAEADRAGLQIMVHAIGPRSNANVLTAFENVIARNGKRDRRFRIEHAARMRKSDLGRLVQGDIIASMQPALFEGGDDDYRTIFARRIRVAFGSDSSMIDIDPVRGIYAAVNSGPNSISVDAAVSAYTLGSAYAEFQEKEKGTLEAGKFADMVILSEDVFTIDPAKVAGVKVLTTIVDGKVVFEAK